MPLTSRLAAVLSLALAACAPQTPSYRQWDDPQVLRPVSTAFLQGTWYEAMRTPAFFTRGCTHVTATYAARADGALDLVNRCRRGGGVSEIRGVATAYKPGRLKVKLEGVPFRGELWVLGTADGGRTLYLGTMARDFAWVLHRDRVFGPEQRAAAQKLFRANGYDEAALQRTVQW
jgi:apolipoprotein D and lipocalin family protein